MQNMQRRPLRCLATNKGFTLVEAFLASIVFALSLFAILLATYTEFSFVNKNREKAIASLAAQEEIESIRGRPFDTILGLGTSFTSSGFSYLKNPVGTLTIDNPYGSNDIRKISVMVTWDSLGGQTMHRELVTMVTHHGINKQ